MARLDTGWCVNQKVLALRVEGIALHAWSISYCDLTRSDGFIPEGSWPTLRWTAAGVRALVDAGMWEPSEGGYMLHDYGKYNRSRAQIEAEQEDARQRQSRHRSRVTDTVTATVTDEDVSRRDTRARGQPGPIPGPGVTLRRDTRDPPTPLADADAQGAPPTRPLAEHDESPPPRWEEVAPGQHRGNPNGVGDISLLTVRCPRCERSMPVAEVENHACELVPGEPVQAPPRRRGGRGLHRLFGSAEAPEPVPAEVQAELDRMEAEARGTPEQVAAVVARLGSPVR